jgi:pimeloyl-ACP methyl ester carboxylesterase
LLRLLVESAADASATNHLQRTPLHSLAGLAAGKLDAEKEAELKEIILFLVQHKADHTVLDIHGRTATEIARSRSKDFGEVFRKICSIRISDANPDLGNPEPVMCSTAWFDAKSGRAWAYRVWRGGPRHILMMPGLFMQKEGFDSLAASLSKRLDATCFVLELYCHGESGYKELTEEVTYESLTADVIEFIETLVITCDFLGVSLSADLGLQIAVQRPDLLRSLVLVACMTDANAEWKHKVEDALNNLKAIEDGVTRGWDRWREVFMASGLVAARFHDSPCVQTVLERQEAMWRRNKDSCPYFLALWNNRRTNFAACMRIFQPTLLVYGAGDKLTVGSAKRFSATLPNSKLTHVPEVNSPVVLECSDELCQVTRTFLTEVSTNTFGVVMHENQGGGLSLDALAAFASSGIQDFPPPRQSPDGVAKLELSRAPIDEESDDEHGLADLASEARATKQVTNLVPLQDRSISLQETNLDRVVDKLMQQGYGLTSV